MIPKKFFITGGKAFSPTSQLNAFDLALKEAGIAQCNLVPVTSILPPNSMEIDPVEIPVGSITFAVISKMESEGDTRIGAGIAWGWEKEGKYGLVAEAHGQMDRDSLREVLEWKIREMAKIREMELGGIKYRIEDTVVPSRNYGCVFAALVYLLD